MAKLNLGQFIQWLYDQRWPGYRCERAVLAITLEPGIGSHTAECPDCRQPAVAGSWRGRPPAFRGKCTICGQAWLLRPFMIAVKLLDSELKEEE